MLGMFREVIVGSFGLLFFGSPVLKADLAPPADKKYVPVFQKFENVELDGIILVGRLRSVGQNPTEIPIGTAVADKCFFDEMYFSKIHSNYSLY